MIATPLQLFDQLSMQLPTASGKQPMTLLSLEAKLHGRLVRAMRIRSPAKVFRAVAGPSHSRTLPQTRSMAAVEELHPACQARLGSNARYRTYSRSRHRNDAFSLACCSRMVDSRRFRGRSCVMSVGVAHSIRFR